MKKTYECQTMQSMLAISLLLLSCGLQAAPAASTPSRFRFRDGHTEQMFELSEQEVLVARPNDQPTLQNIPDNQTLVQWLQQAQTAATVDSEQIHPVLYPVSAPRTEANRRIVTSRILVRGSETAIASLSSHTKVSQANRLALDPEYHVVEASSPWDALELVQDLQARPNIAYAQPLLARKRQPRWVPNDPLFPEQWHLVNTGQYGGLPGIDSNITNVWAAGYRGSNVVIAIIDDGLQHAHPDLAPNYLPELSRNWSGAPGSIYDPAPGTYDSHGTSCAGIAAGRGNNGLGITGAAPFANLAGFRLIAAYYTDLDEAEAMSLHNDVVHIKNNSWGPYDDAVRIEAPGLLSSAAIAEGVRTGRNGRGMLYIWAGGNGLEDDDNSNYDGYANSIYTISVAALANTGKQSYYSEPGACNIVTAPSSGGTRGTVTTDLLGTQGYNNGTRTNELADIDYTSRFGGTSSATPLVAGIVALMLEANPNLGWRDVQDILIRTASTVDATDSDWYTNGAGLTFNHKYGAGLIDAEAAVMAALNWTNLPPAIAHSAASSNLAVTIPDNAPIGISHEISITNGHMIVEHATLTLDITHPHRGELEITLTSPDGTESILAEPHSDPNPDYPNWTFMTVRNWGEHSDGTWTVTISDNTADSVGTLHAANLTLHGTPLIPQMQILPDYTPITTAVGTPLQFTVIATNAFDGSIWLYPQIIPTNAIAQPTNGASSVEMTFSWTPTSEQAGSHELVFVASNAIGQATLERSVTVLPILSFTLPRTENAHITDLDAPLVFAEIAPGSNTLWAAAIVWRVNGGTWQYGPMTTQPNQNGITTYTAHLPPAEAGDLVEYYVYATDFNLQTFSSATNSYHVGISTFYVHPLGQAEWPYNTWQKALQHPQDAVELAQDGQRILVADGTYKGQTIVIDKAITMESENGAESTTIWGEGLRTCLIIQADATVSGFYFAQGFSAGNGGAVSMYAGRLQDSAIQYSHALQGGGGLWMQGGVASHIRVAMNRADLRGGGIEILGGRLENAVIHDNQTQGKGGGAFIADNAQTEHCTIAFNQAAEKGGGIYVEDYPLLRNHIIVSNASTNTADANWFIDGWGIFQATITSPTPESPDCFDLDPLFANPDTRDLHLKSQFGRYTPDGTWVVDSETSPAIDMGYMNSPFSNEPAPNGGRVNLGAYGNTEQASKGMTDLRRLIVLSEHGAVSPSNAVLYATVGATISSGLLQTSVTNGLTRHTAQGWNLWENAYTTQDITTTNAIFSMELHHNAILRWEWDNQHYVTVTALHANVAHQDDWYDEGSELSLAANPDPYYAWGNWSGSTNTTNATLAVTVDQPISLVAECVPLRTTQGTPQFWLASYGWTNNFEAAASLDPDGDLLPNWAEYIAGTDPLNPQSGLRIQTQTQNHPPTISWSVIEGRHYKLEQMQDLRTPQSAQPLLAFEALSSNPDFTIPMPTNTLPNAFFRISVEYHENNE